MEVKSFKLNLENFPLSCPKLPIFISYKLQIRLRRPCMFKVTITYRELCITQFSITPIYDAYIATTKYRTFLLIACDCKLRQV